MQHRNQHPDPHGPIQDPTRRGGGRSLLVPFVLSVAAAVAIAVAGTDALRTAFEDRASAEDWLLLGTAGVGALAFLTLIARLARPGTASIGDAGRSELPTGAPRPELPGTRARSTTARSVPTAGPATAPRRRRPGGIIALAVLAPIIWTIATSADQIADSVREATDARDSIREIAEGPSDDGDGGGPTCPAPAAGADLFDSAESDCLPLEAATFFETGHATIQGNDYVGLANETTSTNDCAAAIEEASDQRLVEGSECQVVLRGLYRTSDGLAGQVSLAAFSTAAEATRVERELSGRPSPFAPLQSRDTTAAPWGRPDAPSFCFAGIGRYLTCVEAAPRTDADRQRAQELVADLAFVATDGIVARRFALR